MNQKMSKIFTVLIVLALATMACGINLNMPKTVKGSGVVSEESRPVDSFDRIEINGLGDITVELGQEEALTIEAEENLLRYINTSVRGSTLVIENEEGVNILPTESVKFYLTVVSLEAITLSGLANISLPELDVDRFNIDISGAGNIDIESLTADNFDVSMSGLGNLTIHDGQVYSQDVTISGSGQFAAGSLESDQATITISGLGSSTMRVNEYLRVTMSGGGSVKYYGNPEVDSEISGLGTLDRLGD